MQLKEENAMDLTNMKKSFFGYNKFAVSNYISALESDYNKKIQDIQKESMDTQASLRSQIDAVREKQEEELQKLRDKIDALTQEKDSLRRDHETIADALLDAQEYAHRLKQQADERAAQRDAEHLQMLSVQQGKVKEFDSRLRSVLDEIREVLQTASDDLSEKAENLQEAGQSIEEEKGRYMPAEEDNAGAALSEGEASGEESISVDDESAVKSAEQEQAESEAKEQAEEEQTVGNASEQTSDGAAAEDADLGTAHHEAVNRFTQAAGEIAEKAAVRAE